jgi:hypothetical protein|eukprot:COSAG02_NODE_4808_length_4955_cov_3.563633_4_plen_136_part_00
MLLDVADNRDDMAPALQLYGGRKRIVLENGTVLPEHDALVLGDALAKFATQPAFQCALEWEEGTLAIWDNQCCLHAVVPFDYDTQTRKMWRVTVGEEESLLPRSVLAAMDPQTRGSGASGGATTTSGAAASSARL